MLLSSIKMLIAIYYSMNKSYVNYSIIDWWCGFRQHCYYEIPADDDNEQKMGYLCLVEHVFFNKDSAGFFRGVRQSKELAILQKATTYFAKRLK